MPLSKRLGLNDIGSSIQVGGNDWDEYYDYHNDVALAGRSAEINTLTTYRSGKLLADGYVDLTKITEPASPAAGKIRLFPSSVDDRIYAKKSNGTLIDLELSNILPLVHSYIIYIDGATYKARSGLTGAVHVTTSATNAALVINAVIADLDALGGGTIFFAPGIYNIAKTGAGGVAEHGVYLGTARNRITFQGSGIDVTKFVCTEAGTLMFIKNTANAAAFLTFKDFTVDGANISGMLLNTINNVTGVLLERTYWTRGNHPSPQIGIDEYDIVVKDSFFTNAIGAGDLCAFHGKRILVDNCYFTRSVSGGGLTTGGTEETVIRNCQWEGYVGYGAISLENIDDSTENIVIDGNHFFNSAQTGASILTTVPGSAGLSHNNITITNNQFEGSGWVCLSRNIHGLNISDNQFWNTQTGQSAIYVGPGGSAIDIHDNTIRNLASGAQIAAIHIEQIISPYAINRGVKIHDNVMIGVDGHGILVRGVKGCSIYSNDFYDLGRLTDSGYRAIFLQNNDSGASIRDDVIIYNNKCNVLDQANKLAYGIETASDTTNTVIYTNRIPSSSFGILAIQTNSAAGVTLVNGGIV